MLTSGISMLLASFAFIALDILHLRKSLIDEQSSHADILTYNCKAAVSFGHKGTAEIILSSLKYQKDIVDACIFDVNNEVFAEYHRDQSEGDSRFPQPREDNTYFQHGHLHLFQKIYLDNEVIGTVYIRSDLSQIWSKLNQYSSIGIVILILVFFITYLLSSKLQRIISIPIVRLSKVANTITSEKNYLVRATKESDDELGDLVDAFNSMLEQIHLEQQNRDRIEKVLRESEANFRSFFNNSSTGNMEMDIHGQFERTNIRFSKMLDYSEEELLELKDIDLTHPEDKKITESIMTQFLNKEIESSRFEKRYVRKDGSVFWSDISITYVDMGMDRRDKLIGVVVNISERKKIEKKLTEHHNLLSTLIDTLPDVIFVKDVNHKFIVVNNAFLEQYNVDSKEELIGKSDLDFYPQEDAEIFHTAENIIMNGKPQIDKLDLVIKDSGERQWLNNTKLPLKDSEGHITGLVGISRDITENKNKEEELRNYQEHLEEIVKERTQEVEEKAIELEEANIRLQELDRLKSIFLASMSHELRTPLNSIIGFTGIILMGMSGELNDEQKKQLTMVKNNANHLLSLINDILDISKIEAGRAEVHAEEFILNDLVNEIVASSSPLADDRGIALKNKLSKNIVLFNDPRRIKQILINLISNAIKFTNEGSVTVDALLKDEKTLIFSVADTGIGVKKEDMRKLFIPFQQIDATLTKKYEGTGLGLSLTQKMTGLLGGNISVKTEYGKGTKFTVTMPLNYSEEENNEKNSSY